MGKKGRCLNECRFACPFCDKEVAGTHWGRDRSGNKRAKCSLCHHVVTLEKGGVKPSAVGSAASGGADIDVELEELLFGGAMAFSPQRTVDDDRADSRSSEGPAASSRASGAREAPDEEVLQRAEDGEWSGKSDVEEGEGHSTDGDDSASSVEEEADRQSFEEENGMRGRVVLSMGELTSNFNIDGFSLWAPSAEHNSTIRCSGGVHLRSIQVVWPGREGRRLSCAGAGQAQRLEK